MKLKTILLSLFLLLSTSVFADNNENCYTSADVEQINGLYYLTGQDNPFTGTSKCVYSGTGQIKSLTEIWDGKRDGKFTSWHKNGQKVQEINYKDGKLDGKWTTWHENGQKKSERFIRNGKRDGKMTEWYDNGQIKAEKNYINGELDGKVTTWHENGQIQVEDNYINGKLDGKVTEWYYSGQKRREVNYKDGEREGKFTTWYYNGQIEKVEYYENGVREGDTDKVNKLRQKTIETLTRKANNGNTNAMSELGWLYNNMGNYEQAFKWWKQSAELVGKEWQQADLGHAYLRGEGTPQDLDQAEYWLLKAAEQGNDWVQQYLIEVYQRKGDTDKANKLRQKAIETLTRKYEQAFKWWKQSAELGNNGAQAELGHAYLRGEGTPQDLDQAEYWLTKAAEQGNDWAQRNLIEVYQRKGDTDKANKLRQNTIETLTRKANNGNTDAMDELGWLYNDNRNNEQAFYWFSKCAELGHSGCMNGLGRLYMWGEGVPANLGLAEYWLTKAVDAGNEWAVNSLGELYVEGGSYPTALKWFNKALESSDTWLRAGAMKGIGRLYQKEGDTRKSVIWWQQAAELGDSGSQAELGYAYLNGNGISRDLELAKKWLTLAVQRGEKWAQEGLDELKE